MPPTIISADAMRPVRLVALQFSVTDAASTTPAPVSCTTSVPHQTASTARGTVENDHIPVRIAPPNTAPIPAPSLAPSRWVAGRRCRNTHANNPTSMRNDVYPAGIRANSCLSESTAGWVPSKSPANRPPKTKKSTAIVTNQATPIAPAVMRQPTAESVSDRPAGGSEPPPRSPVASRTTGRRPMRWARRRPVPDRPPPVDRGSKEHLPVADESRTPHALELDHRFRPAVATVGRAHSQGRTHLLDLTDEVLTSPRSKRAVSTCRSNPCSPATRSPARSRSSRYRGRIDLARQHGADLILLDLNLPDTPGRDVLGDGV